MTGQASPVTDTFVHPALFYQNDTEYLAGTVPFITDGLANQEPVAVAVPGPRLVLLQAELGSASEQVRFLDMTVVGRNPGRIIPGVLRAFADDHRTGRVRIIGEPIWPGRSETEYPACVQHEALINLAFAGRSVSILCPYDTAGLAPEVIADAVATHPVLIDSTGHSVSEDYAPEQVVAAYNQPLPVPANAVSAVFDAKALRGLRPFAADYGREAGLTDERVDDLVLVLTELATNCVEHGGGSGTAHFWTAENCLICQVTNDAALNDPLVGRNPAAPDQLRGRGVLLVNHLADLVRMHTTTSRTAIQAHFAL
jgi:anti-sigma regulatory factor (Ser/Thr protein kinase)